MKPQVSRQGPKTWGCFDVNGGEGATAVLSGKFRLSTNKSILMPASSTPQVRSGYRQRQGLGSQHSLVGDKVNPVAMCPQRAGALRERKLSERG